MEGDGLLKITVELSEEEMELFKKFAKRRWQFVPEMMREVVMEKIEDDYDLMAYEETVEGHRSNQRFFSLDEVKKELGFL